jgi:hypothetical protein
LLNYNNFFNFIYKCFTGKVIIKKISIQILRILLYTLLSHIAHQML